MFSDRVDLHPNLCEVSELSDPNGGASVNFDKQICHVVMAEHSDPIDNCLVFTSPASKKGVGIDIYEQCIRGICSCKHAIGNSDSQLKLCRFAALLFGNNRKVSDDEMSMFSGMVDAFSIASTEVASYDNFKYLSILSDESIPKMDAIVKNEISNGMLEVVSEKPKCIHTFPWGSG